MVGGAERKGRGREKRREGGKRENAGEKTQRKKAGTSGGAGQPWEAAPCSPPAPRPAPRRRSSREPLGSIPGSPSWRPQRRGANRRGRGVPFEALVPTAGQKRQERLEEVTSTAGPSSTARCFWVSSPPLPDAFSLHLPRHPTHHPTPPHTHSPPFPDIITSLWGWEPRWHPWRGLQPGAVRSPSSAPRPLGLRLPCGEFVGLSSGVGRLRSGGDRLYTGVVLGEEKDY